jgi:hypothetical protein
VRAGRLLHDIGVYRLYDAAGKLDHANYIRHGFLGYGLLAEEGFPEAVGRSREQLRQKLLDVAERLHQELASGT